MNTPKMNCAIISPDPATAERFSSELTYLGDAMGAVDYLRDYPGREVLLRILRLNATDLFLVDCADLSRALEVIETIRSQNVHVAILALCREDVESLSSLMRAGVRDYIPAGATVDMIREVLASALEKLSNKPKQGRIGGDVVAFLPSKPGCGASTISAHTSLSASKSPSKRILLIDLDRDAPVQAFIHCLHAEHFLQEALANSHKMEADLWSRLISQRGELDILPSDADGASPSEGGRMEQLLAFFRRAYDLTCIDLPGPLDPLSVEVLMECTRVYLVCTQELASVHIALRKAERLKRLGFGKEIRLLLNRFEANHVMNEARVAALVGLPVELCIPNCYALATAFSEKGAHIDPSTSLGKSYTRLAEILLDDRIEMPRRRRKFLEFFYQPLFDEGFTPSPRADR